MRHRYTWVPDLPDIRDHVLKVGAGSLPRVVDRRSQCSAIENQGPLGSCTGNAIVGLMEFLLIKEGVAFVDLSRLFVYYLERSAEGTVRSDSGAMIRTGIKQVHKHGVCPEPIWPYEPARFKRRPTVAAYKMAQQYRTSEYSRVLGLDAMKRSLADGFPVVFGFTVYAGFESDETARTGLVTMPVPGEKMVGGHAVMAVGYDDDAQALIVRNSWGPDWGLAGYFMLPYGYVEHRGLSDDFWTIRR